MSNTWEEKWFEDIDYLKENLIKDIKIYFFIYQEMSLKKNKLFKINSK